MMKQIAVSTFVNVFAAGEARIYISFCWFLSSPTSLTFSHAARTQSRALIRCLTMSGRCAVMSCDTKPTWARFDDERVSASQVVKMRDEMRCKACSSRNRVALSLSISLPVSNLRILPLDKPPRSRLIISKYASDGLGWQTPNFLVWQS